MRRKQWEFHQQAAILLQLMGSHIPLPPQPQPSHQAPTPLYSPSSGDLHRTATGKVYREVSVDQLLASMGSRLA